MKEAVKDMRSTADAYYRPAGNPTDVTRDQHQGGDHQKQEEDAVLALTLY